ncbi:hypothetical protein [Guptibacillus hwajinpoensis]|uniref:Uncharacterized protein n=1 Tax=Guptibacillus hwajinpoensis TaxID=208199 RepID=A0A0J6CWZ0_9BACL|nr:hypothetical protein [Alkalihalobacillus macyae]KMM37695.1 hypothetical protein AB986_14090 [Alkalihalobacillus macyae]
MMSISYYYVNKNRKLIGFQLGMNISTIIGGMAAMTTGILLIYQYPFHFTWITIISTLTGIFIGSLFGGMFDYQTLLTGYGSGMTMGLMAPMIGASANFSTLFIGLVEAAFGISFIILFLAIRNS